MFAFESLQTRADIGDTNGGNVFEVGNQLDQLLVLWLSLPRLEQDGVFGLGLDVVWVGVDDDGLAEGSI